jgi:hypothetical protein
MKRAVRTSLGAVALFAVLAGACAPALPPVPAGPTSAELKTAADALDLQFKDAFNRGDAEALAATYWNSPDMVSMAPDGMAKM